MPQPQADATIAWKRISGVAVRLFHEYANWLVGITWKRFGILALLLIILTSLLEQLPPFSWEMSRAPVEAPPLHLPPPPPPLRGQPTTPRNPEAAPPPAAPTRGGGSRNDDDVLISIDKNGIRVAPRPRAPADAAAGASAPADAASGLDPAAPSAPVGSSVEIALPGASREAIREAARAVREAARGAAEDARHAAEEARRDADDARREAQQAVEEARRDVAEANAEAAQATRQYKRMRIVRLGDFLSDLALLFIVASAILKATYKGRVQAEVKAAVATETAESEQLKRQVVEARMAAMQAQVEPHFLFNTLASIDHLIQTDPPRASQMQKNLIALLRASMPTMRESHPTAHNLGREMAVIRPYLEILKVRMEERLQARIEVSDGLLSADFPPMMIQSLVENAIKHGLEPKPEGGLLTVRAEIVHGKLCVDVADTGLGFGRAATAGTGVGLNNIRERLQLLYANQASMTVAENPPSGTRVTLTVPYLAQAGEGTVAG